MTEGNHLQRLHNFVKYCNTPCNILQLAMCCVCWAGYDWEETGFCNTLPITATHPATYCNWQCVLCVEWAILGWELVPQHFANYCNTPCNVLQLTVCCMCWVGYDWMRNTSCNTLRITATHHASYCKWQCDVSVERAIHICVHRYIYIYIFHVYWPLWMVLLPFTYIHTYMIYMYMIYMYIYMSYMYVYM